MCFIYTLKYSLSKINDKVTWIDHCIVTLFSKASGFQNEQYFY